MARLAATASPAVARSVKLADLPGVLGPWLDRFAQERSERETFGDFVHQVQVAVSLVLDDPPAPVALAWPRRRTEAPFATPLTDTDLRTSRRFDGAPAEEVVRWAATTFGLRLTVAARWPTPC